MRHGCLAEENLAHVDMVVSCAVGAAVGLGREGCSESFGDVFTESSDFADFLEEDEGCFWSVAVDADA